MKILLNILIIVAQAFMEIMVLEKIVYNDKKYSNKQIFTCFIVFLSQMIISNYILPSYLRYIFSIIVFVGITFFILKKEIIESFTCSILSILFISLIEVLITLLFFSFGITQNDILENIISKFLLNITISTFSILTISLVSIKNLILKIKKLCIKGKKFFKYGVILLIIIYLILAKNILFTNITIEMIINVSILFIAIFLFFTILLSDNKNRQLEETNKQMLNYVTKYEKIITDQGKANHEFKNQLMVIRGYAQMNSPKLIEYLDSIVDDTRKSHSSYLISQLNKFPDGGIKGLLYYKLSVMEDIKIKYDINVESGVKTKLKLLSTNMYKNITKILGVLLDNSIDASKQTRNKKVNILVTKEKSNIVFNIYNTYKGKIDLQKIGTGYTTKGKGHGYGLRLVKDIISGNKSFKLENNIEDEYYVSKLSIKINDKRKK